MRSIAPIPRSMRVSVLVMVGFALSFGLWLAFLHYGSTRAAQAPHLAEITAPLLVLPIALRPLPSLWRAHRPARRAQLWLVLGIVASTAGQLVWAWYEFDRHRPAPFPSWADLCCLLAYPCLLLGVLYLPVARNGAPGRTRVIFDSLIVMVAAGTASWYFLIGPALLRSDIGLLARAVGAAYPLGDLMLVGGVLALLAHAHDRSLRGEIGLLAIALGVIVVTDSVFYSRSLQAGYRVGGLLDIGWPLGNLLVVLGIQAPFRALTERHGWTEVPATAARRWRTLLPYATLPPMLLLIIHSRFTTPAPGPLDRGLAIGTMLLILAVIARQVLAILENQRLQETATASARLLEVSNRELGSANAQLEVLATTDPVTELPNHRALVLELERERDRAARYGRSFAILFVDLDHFKAINDGYGHATGDAVLAEVGGVLRAALREVDTVGRWGGEEFLAILPEIGTSGALAAAERVRHAVAQHRFMASGGLHLTCSIGVNRFHPEGGEVDRLITLADQALYTAKKLGRNQVRAVGDPAVAGLLDSAEEPRDALALAGTVEALAATIAARDPQRAAHAERVPGLVLDLALACGLHAAEARLLALVARVHDLGKVAVPDAILQKPGALTAEEWAIVRTHPAVGADILRRIPALRAAVPLVRAHHEHWGGSGYPDGLAGTAIPLGARVLAVADAFAALTSDRPYRYAFTEDEALAIVERESGTRFDPQVVACLEQVVAITAGVSRSARGRRLRALTARDAADGIPEEFDWEALVSG